jgi:hypothetical protein
VPADLRDDAISFRTDDHVELRGLVLGNGSSGVLLTPCTGATAVAATAQKISGLKGLVLLTPLALTRRGTELDAVAGVRAVEVPSFVAAARNDILADGAHEVAGAASDSRLKIVPGAASGAALIENSAMRDDVRAFAREAMPPRTFPERWTLPISGVVLLALAVAGVVVLRRRNTTSPPDVSAGS